MRNTMGNLKIVIILGLLVGSTIAAPTTNLVNGHTYDFIAGLLTWQAARDAAASTYYNGQQGYLCTITDQQEQDFLYENFYSNGTGWLGGSDAAQEGHWYWMTGPEAGTMFWHGGSLAVGGYPVGYAHFRINEPSNGGGGEDYLSMRGEEGYPWNDLAANHYYVAGYFVEYSTDTTVPVPGAIALTGFGFLCVTWFRFRR